MTVIIGNERLLKAAQRTTGNVYAYVSVRNINIRVSRTLAYL
jgi:hypothetical protein